MGQRFHPPAANEAVRERWQGAARQGMWGIVGDSAPAAGGGRARDTAPYCLLHKITGDNIFQGQIHHTNVTPWYIHSLPFRPQHMGTPSSRPQGPRPPVLWKFLGENGW